VLGTSPDLSAGGTVLTVNNNLNLAGSTVLNFLLGTVTNEVVVSGNFSLGGTSSNFWARAIGWYGMALVDVLDYFPTNHPARPGIVNTLQKLARGVAKYQDPQTGLWYQVVDQGERQGNYLEATASSMFVYTLAKGVNKGYLPRSFAPIAAKGYRGLIQTLVKVNGQNDVALMQCCSVAGLGNGRDGSYHYYIHEPVVDNDLKGVGPFILAGLEVQQLPRLGAAGIP
jgi:unsaturated rhamnogalacturonyl hydrolase